MESQTTSSQYSYSWCTWINGSVASKPHKELLVPNPEPTSNISWSLDIAVLGHYGTSLGSSSVDKDLCIPAVTPDCTGLHQTTGHDTDQTKEPSPSSRHLQDHMWNTASLPEIFSISKMQTNWDTTAENH